MTHISRARVLIVATDGFEQPQLEYPRDVLRNAGAMVEVASPDGETITGWHENNWGDPVHVDRKFSEVKAAGFDALILPGSRVNPDALRTRSEVTSMIKRFSQKGAVVAAMCHAPRLLIEAGLVAGRSVTSNPAIRTDLQNAGGRWENSNVIADNRVVTAKSQDHLEAFVSTLVEEIQRASQQRRAA